MKKEFIEWSKQFLLFNNIQFPELVSLMCKLLYFFIYHPGTFKTSNPIIGGLLSEIKHINHDYEEVECECIKSN